MTTIVVLRGRIGRDEAPALCERVRAAIEGGGPRRVICDVGLVREPDACTVDALARMQLTAHAAGGRLCLAGTSSDLRCLVALAGLAEVLPSIGGSGVEAVRQAEEREQVRGVEEERDARDGPV